MDPIATLLLARTHTVVLDADRAASAATRPARDVDIERFEDELLQLGFVLSLDLAMTLRRLPHQTLRELESWIVGTLARCVATRPHVPLVRATGDHAPYARRVAAWLATHAEQPCPWCGETTIAVRALAPCGHLVCHTCWSSGTFAGCPICHRRVTPNDPFVRVADAERVQWHDGRLALLHVAFDAASVARARFERLLVRTTTLARDHRDELEAIIDTMGPQVARWLPARIPVRETMAIALARLWMIAADRTGMMAATHGHVASATDVLRIAAVLMQGNAALVEPMRLASIPRSLRRALLAALERLPPDSLVEDMRRHRPLWKRVGERLHPGEHAAALPNVAAAFAAVRGERTQPTWAGSVEAALASGDARTATTLLARRPGELLRRADQLARATPADVVAAVRAAVPQGAPEVLLQLAAHVAARDHAWPRRVFVPHGDVFDAFAIPDARPPLARAAIDAIIAATREELLARAAARRNFARAVIDRDLAMLLLSPRGSELPLGDGEVSVAVHADRELEVVFACFDERWRHCGTSRELATGARHALVIVSSPVPIAFDHVAIAIADRRLALRGHARVAIPLAIDLAARRARWLDVYVAAPPRSARLARLARDVADFAHARATLWDVAAIHAAARANTIYVRAASGTTIYKRRDGEPPLARLARLHAGEHDGVSRIPPANAPTWFALLRDDVALPAGSEGYVLDARGSDGVKRLGVADLLAALAKR